MNLEETVRILASVAIVDPAIRDRDSELLAQVWQQVFADVPYAEVNRALGAFFATDTKGFPPTPGAVNAFVRKARQLNEPSENEVWALVVKAASRSTYYSREEFEKLPEDVREIVGSPRILYEWAQADPREMNTVIAAGFRRAWRERQELKRELGLYPALAAPDGKKAGLPAGPGSPLTTSA